MSQDLRPFRPTRPQKEFLAANLRVPFARESCVPCREARQRVLSLRPRIKHLVCDPLQGRVLAAYYPPGLSPNLTDAEGALLDGSPLNERDDHVPVVVRRRRSAF